MIEGLVSNSEYPLDALGVHRGNQESCSKSDRRADFQGSFKCWKASKYYIGNFRNHILGSSTFK